MLPTFCPPTIWAISLEFGRKPYILEADDLLGACYRKAMTPKKLWTLLLFRNVHRFRGDFGCNFAGALRFSEGPNLEKIQYLSTRLNFSSEIETNDIFKWDWKVQASHPPNPYFCGGGGGILKIKIEHFERDWSFQARLKIQAKAWNLMFKRSSEIFFSQEKSFRHFFTLFHTSPHFSHFCRLFPPGPFLKLRHF